MLKKMFFYATQPDTQADNDTGQHVKTQSYQGLQGRYGSRTWPGHAMSAETKPPQMIIFVYIDKYYE